MRSMGSATIGFGLVSAPVKIYGATESKTGVSFNLLHGRCGGKLSQQYVCPACAGEVVPRESMVKGCEHEGKYVTFTAAEIKSLEEASSGTIAIEEFVPLATVDAVHYDKPYYLAPDKGGAKAYALLAAAMHKTGRAGLARYAARGKQHVVALRAVSAGSPTGSKVAIVMQQLLYADEVRPLSGVPDVPSDSEVSDRELAMATMLVESIAGEKFDPSKYADGVRARVLAAVAAKAAGGEVAAAPEKPAAKVIDIMAALEASLRAVA